MVIIDKEFKKNVGLRLKSLRKLNGLTILGLIDKLQSDYFIDVDEKSIRRYETGEFLPKIDNLICLSDLFSVSIDYLLFGKETSDDNSCTYYDNFKRLNRLIYSLSAKLVENEATGRYYLELWEEEFKLYWERINNFGVEKNYFYEKRDELPVFTLKDLDNLFIDFIKYKEQLTPTKERFDKFLSNQEI